MRSISGRSSLEAIVVAFVGTVSVAVAVVHVFALLARAALGPAGNATALALTGVTVLVAAWFALASAFFDDRRLMAVGAAGSAVAAAYVAWRGGGPANGAAVFACSLTQVLVFRSVCRRVDPYVAGRLGRRPVRALLWALLGVLLLVQSARLSTFMADPSFDWWLTTRDELWAKHMCMPAYVEAADLHRQGTANVYQAEYYAAIVRRAKPHLTVAHLDLFAGDPFQYPPQFLLLPRLALSLTNDFLVMRTVWYALQVVALVGVTVALGLWVGPEAGAAAIFLIPLLWASIPTMQSLQYGQFHLAALLLAMGGMLCFERGRHALGGALLAAAVLGKIFPGALLLLLVVQRRWRDVAWTAAFMGMLTAAALLVLGPDPFNGFLTYQLPRLADGRAFDFVHDWPELRVAYAANDLSPTALLVKVQELGVAGLASSLGPLVRRGYAVLLIGLVVVAGVRRQRGSNLARASLWLAVLNLAALNGYAAWGDYITLGSVWLLTLRARDLRGLRARTILLGVCWILCVLVPGVEPIPVFLPARLAMVLTSGIVVAMLALNAWVILKVPQQEASASAVAV